MNVPDTALLVLVGVAGSGKSTFANAHFRGTEILSSDRFRGMVSDDEGDQEATDDAFTVLHLVLDKRLQRGRLCVVDATNLSAKHRATLIECARLYQRTAVAVLLDTPEEVCQERAQNRMSRIVSADVIRDQMEKWRGQTESDLLAEGFHKVFRVTPSEQVEIQRTAAAARAK